MKVSAIFAVGPNAEIGNLGKMAWDYPSEYQHFLKSVSGHHIVMGRVNWEDNATNTKLLSRVTTLVVSSQKDYLKFDQTHTDFEVLAFTSLEAAISFAKSKNESELFVIGGAGLFESGAHLIDCVYYSAVPYSGPADTFFPISVLKNFKLVDTKIIAATSDSPEWELRIFLRK